MMKETTAYCRTQDTAPAWTAWAFAAATFLGAFLLFQVQPLISRFILPWFGGVPAVWTTCVLFFQVVLFAGYAYSHLVVVRLSTGTQAIAQGLLLLAAVAALPIAPGAAWKPTSGSAPTAQILLLLTATVGLPYFVLSTASPLIQAWFSRTFPGRNPYRLYALSNAGSLLALLSYPFVFEPAFDLATQSRLWSWAFPVFAALTAICGAAVWRSTRGTAQALAEAGTSRAFQPEFARARSKLAGATGMPSLRWHVGVLWLLLPACASLVLLATTNHVCEDVAAVPFLWVVPLSLYLLTFILCFDRPRWYLRPLWSALTVVGIAAVMGSNKTLGWIAEPNQREGMSLSYAYQLVVHFGTMFCICMVCHGELVRLRPDSRHLTAFYLMLSAGGALGSAIVGLAAPHLFKTFLEWNIGMLTAYAAATVVLFLAVPKRGPRRRAALLLCGFALGGAIPVLTWQGTLRGEGASGPRLVDRQRDFYGVVSVWEYDRDQPDLHRRGMKNGAILHGEQLAAAEKRREPLNYYTRESGVSRAILELQKRCNQLRIGVVGLGVGTLACFARQGDQITFYEINPAVLQLAETHFTFLGDARARGATIDVEMGDGRLVLERQVPQQFHLLVVDAFSGSSVPVHLLTREAMDVYRRHLAAGGAIVIHATNSHLYLVPVVRALAEDAHLNWRRVHTVKDARKLCLASDWVVIGGSESFLSAIPDVPPPASQQDDFTIPVWTDQNNNLFRILIGSK